MNIRLEIIDKFKQNPARIHNHFLKKGIIQVGLDADFVIFDPKKVLVINSSHSQSDYSPYDSLKITGVDEDKKFSFLEEKVFFRLKSFHLGSCLKN